MSKRQQVKNEALLRELYELPENRRCADCGARNPGWASWNLGVFLCIRCAGIHRKMGTHISKVKSLSVDAWTTEQIFAMKEMGNKKANSIWDPNNERSRYLGKYDGDDDSVVERYIRDKYERGKFRRDMEGFTQERAAYDNEYNSSSRSGPSSSSSSRWFRRSKKDQSDGGNHVDSQESSRSRRHKNDDIYHLNDRRNTVKETYEYDDDYEYEDKIYKLLDMGFNDRKRNLEALTKSKGDLLTAIEYLTNQDESEKRPALPARPGNSGPSSSETSQVPSRNVTGAPNSQQAQYTGTQFGPSQTVYDQFGNAIGVFPVQQFQPPTGIPPQFAQPTGAPEQSQQQQLPPQLTGIPQNFQPPPHPPPWFQSPMVTGAPQPFNLASDASQHFPSFGAGPQQPNQLAPQTSSYNPALQPTNGLDAGISYQQRQIQPQQPQQYDSSFFSPQLSGTQNGVIPTAINSQLLETHSSRQKPQQSTGAYQSTDLVAGLVNKPSSQQPASLTSAFQNMSLQPSQALSAQTHSSNPLFGQQPPQQPSQVQFLPAQQHQQQHTVASPLFSQPTGLQGLQATGYPQMPQSNILFPPLQPPLTQDASLQQSQPQQPVSQQPQRTGFYQYHTSSSDIQQPPLPPPLSQQQPLPPQHTQQPTQLQQQPFALQQPMQTGYGPKVDKSTILSLYSHPDYYSSPVALPVGGIPPAPTDMSRTQINGAAKPQEENRALKPGHRNPFLDKQQSPTQPQQQSRDIPVQREHTVRFDDSGRVSPDAFGQLSAWTGGSNARRS
ncbi:uncharacterized protein V1513DRAFT_436758 [Lipomyces chichibuensis]|uniref:uncharacterized protein n=1 Tax=Lipomyces chichibuensis TaxID=1546026 RepID=UPI003343AC90